MPRLGQYSLDYGVASLYLAGFVSVCFIIRVFVLLVSQILTISPTSWILIATIISGAAGYIQLVPDPWMKLLKAYLEFREIDNYVKSFRDRLIYDEIIYRFVHIKVGRWMWELYRLLPTWKATRPELPSATATFQYTPITATRSFRLLKILKWSPIHGIHAEVQETSLDGIIAYEAISYRWGDPPERLRTRTITLNGHIFTVSQNVYDILEHRSSIYRHVYIWIDFICINQENILERNQQVKLMKEIYQRATNVIIWLGPAPYGHLAIVLFYKIYNVKYNLKMTNEGIHDMYSRDGSRHTRPWHELAKLFRNPYFNRVWVIQEITSASSIKVLYDGKTIDWSILLLVMDLFLDTHVSLLFLSAHDGDFLTRNKPPNEEIAHCMAMASLQSKIRVGEGVALKDAVKWTRGFEAGDPKDQVFALVGITEDPSHRLLVPDYRKSARDSFRDMSLYLLSNHDPFILYYAGCGHDSKPYAASKDTKANIVTYPQNADIIQISCFIIDTITFLGSPNSPYRKTDSTFKITSQVFNHTSEAKTLAAKHAPDPYHTGQSLDEAFWRAAMGDKTLTGRPAPGEYSACYSCFVSLYSNPAKLEKQIQILEQGLKGKGKPADLENVFGHDYQENSRMATKYTAMTSLVSVDKRFCVTEKGYIGWVPNGSMVGDKVTLILGAQTPFVMRRYEGALGEVDRDELDFVLVGACYLHGLMDGEGLDGNEEVKHVILH